MRLRAPDDAPSWAAKFAGYVERAIRGPRDAPLGLAAYTVAALPAAADWIHGAVWVTDISRIAVSNGSNWIRTDTGASL
ncbi:MAG: hypothetical protein ACM3YM_03705 [Sphingomonadales bacterium]